MCVCLDMRLSAIGLCEGEATRTLFAWSVSAGRPSGWHAACASQALRISGLVVEYIVAIDVTRVRFPADAFHSDTDLVQVLPLKTRHLKPLTRIQPTLMAVLATCMCPMEGNSPRSSAGVAPTTSLYLWSRNICPGDDCVAPEAAPEKSPGTCPLGCAGRQTMAQKRSKQ